MRVIALLSWYEEPPAWLAECVASIARLCDHLVAVDGPYAAFPGALRKPFSSSEQTDAILRTAAGAGMGCTIHQSREPWWGNEVEKRNFMFKLGSTFAKSEDWFLRIDADEVLTHIPPDTRKQLAKTESNVAEAMMWTREIEEWYASCQQAGTPVGSLGDYESPLRCLFRALPGIGIEQAHYLVTAPVDGRRIVLRGDGKVHKEEPAEPLWDVRIEHRTNRRTAQRKQSKSAYGDVMGEIEIIEPFEEK